MFAQRQHVCLQTRSRSTQIDPDRSQIDPDRPPDRPRSTQERPAGPKKKLRSDPSLPKIDPSRPKIVRKGFFDPLRSTKVDPKSPKEPSSTDFDRFGDDSSSILVDFDGLRSTPNRPQMSIQIDPDRLQIDPSCRFLVSYRPHIHRTINRYYPTRPTGPSGKPEPGEDPNGSQATQVDPSRAKIDSRSTQGDPRSTKVGRPGKSIEPINLHR